MGKSLRFPPPGGRGGGSAVDALWQRCGSTLDLPPSPPPLLPPLIQWVIDLKCGNAVIWRRGGFWFEWTGCGNAVMDADNLHKQERNAE